MSDRPETTATEQVPTESPRVSEDLLLARFREKALSCFLLAALEPKVLVQIAPRLHLSPLPGKRMVSMRPADHALLLARTSLDDDKPRKAVVEALNAALPRPLFEADLPLDLAEVERWLGAASQLPLTTRLSIVLSLLATEAHKDRVLAAIEGGLLHREDAPKGPAPKDDSAELRARMTKAELRAENAEKKSKSEIAAIEHRELGLKQRIEVLNVERSELQARAGEKNREFEEMRDHVERLKADLQVAFRRAARFKHTLDEAKSLSDREKELKEAFTKERLRAEIEQSKVEILEYQLDLMEQEDHAEDVPQQIRAHDPTPDLVAQYLEEKGRSPRILIVGGAGKQRSHRERDFGALKQRLGVEGEWRFAEYGSWHRDLPRLRNDLRDRYDLVFVLHWNRTTFVQKMHDEARALNGRVRTVPYRGFLSLELAVAEELQRFCRENLGQS